MMNKCVFVIDAELPIGLIANTAAVLAMSLGRMQPHLVGPDLYDRDNNRHVGLTTIVMPILQATAEGLRIMKEKAESLKESGLLLVDVTDAAQKTKNYSDYSHRIKASCAKELRYLGICLYGPVEIVKSLTGSLPLLK